MSSCLMRRGERRMRKRCIPYLPGNLRRELRAGCAGASPRTPTQTAAAVARERGAPARRVASRPCEHGGCGCILLSAAAGRVAPFLLRLFVLPFCSLVLLSFLLLLSCSLFCYLCFCDTHYFTGIVHARVDSASQRVVYIPLVLYMIVKTP